MDVNHASDAKKTQIKLLYYKKWHYLILKYLLKDKLTEEVVSEMDIIINLHRQEISRLNKCQMRFIEELVLKEDVDRKCMITAITC